MGKVVRKRKEEKYSIVARMVQHDQSLFNIVGLKAEKIEPVGEKNQSCFKELGKSWIRTRLNE